MIASMIALVRVGIAKAYRQKAARERKYLA